MSNIDLERIRRLHKAGSLFQSIDLARKTIKSNPDNVPHDLSLLYVQMLARAGSLREARIQYKALFLNEAKDIDSRALGARLLKDAAYKLRSDEQTPLLTLARNAYLEIFQDTDDTFPGINAATLSVFIGETETAQSIAQQIFNSLSNLENKKGYWDYATLAEACIILGDNEGAKKAIQQASLLPEVSLADKASTLKQVDRLLAVIGEPQNILTPLRPRPVLHFTGHMMGSPARQKGIRPDCETELRIRIKDIITKINPQKSFGSLACGADIVIVEELLERGLDVHLVFPFSKDDFLETSVLPAGELWKKRFEDCYKACEKNVTYITEQSYMGDDVLFGLCSKICMGKALLTAQIIDAEVIQLAVWDGRSTTHPAGTAHDVKLWSKRGEKSSIINIDDLCFAPNPSDNNKAPKVKSLQSTRTNVTMMFGDFSGFSKLKDNEMPHFVGTSLSAAAQVMLGQSSQAQVMNTWGDGIFGVWSDPVKAAAIALDIIDELENQRLNTTQENAVLPIRISLHYGVAHKLFDPILNQHNYFGEAVSRAARIDPITPIGEVYVTEQVAAMIILENNTQLHVEYVGLLESAKGYGRIALYRVYRRS